MKVGLWDVRATERDMPSSGFSGRIVPAKWSQAWRRNSFFFLLPFVSLICANLSLNHLTFSVRFQKGLGAPFLSQKSTSGRVWVCFTSHRFRTLKSDWSGGMGWRCRNRRGNKCNPNWKTVTLTSDWPLTYKLLSLSESMCPFQAAFLPHPQGSWDKLHHPDPEEISVIKD